LAAAIDDVGGEGGDGGALSLDRLSIVQGVCGGAAAPDFHLALPAPAHRERSRQEQRPEAAHSGCRLAQRGVFVDDVAEKGECE
jgi:hypothetical protein